MAIETIEAKVTKGDRAGQVFSAEYDMPQSIDEAVERFGHDVVYSNFRGAITIAVQSVMRTAIMKDDASPESVQEAVDKYQPKLRAEGKSLTEKAEDILSRLTPEERAEILKQYLES